MENLPFDPETVVLSYKTLSSGKTKLEKQQANQYILRFIVNINNQFIQQSESAWLVAEKLLLPDQAPETQFIGAQLQSIDMSKSRIVAERLCMCCSYIAIRSCNTFWEDSIQNIISFGTVDQKQCYIALLIIKHIAIIFDSHIFERRITSAVEAFIRNNLNQVLEYLNQILTNPQSVAPECYLEAFSTAKNWCDYSSKTFIPHEGFITTLFQILNGNSHPTHTLKIIKILRQLLIKSKFVKLLESVQFDLAFQEIPQKDQSFLQLIIQYLQSQRDLFIKAANSSIDDEDAQEYADKYATLLITLCSNYEILLIKESEISQTLFQLLLDCASCVDDLASRESVFKPYVDIFKILLVQCKKSQTQAASQEDQDEIDQQERGLSILRYRDSASDVFFKSYFLMRKIFKEQGQKLVFDLILQNLQNQEDPQLYESTIFATKSILDAIDQSLICLEFLKVVFESMVNSRLITQNYQVARGCVSFIHEGSAQYIQAFPQLLQGVIELLLFCSSTYTDLQDLVFKTILEVCLQCRDKFGDTEFKLLYQYLENNHKAMKQEHISNLMEGICTVCSELPQEIFGTAIQNTLKIAIGHFASITTSQIMEQDRFDLAKSILMFSSSIKAIENVNEVILFQALKPIIDQIWPILCMILEIRFKDADLILHVCSLIQRLINALKVNIKQLFPNLSRSLIVCFQHQPENLTCLKVFSTATQVLGRDQDILPQLAQSYNEICQILLNSFIQSGVQQSLDFLNTDLIQGLSELMLKIAEIDISILKQSNYFHDIILLFHNTLVSINQQETNTALVLFFSYLISNRNAQDIVSQYIDLITIALICSISKEQGQLLEKLTAALIILMNNAEKQGADQKLKEIVGQALQKDMFSQINDRVKNLFINILFGLKHQRNKIKLALVNFNGLVNGILQEDSFIGLEIEANNAIKIKQQQEQMKGGVTAINID